MNLVTNQKVATAWIKVEISSRSLSVSQVYRVDKLPANDIPGDILDDILGKLRLENFKFSRCHNVD